MPPISKFKVEDQVLEKLFKLLFEVVGKSENQSEFEKIMHDVLSPVERVMIAKRIAIIYLLTKNIDYLTICEVLKVSAATVAKFRHITDNSQGIIPTLNKILRNDKIKEFLEEFWLLIRGPGVPGVNWSAAWKHKLEFERKKSQGI